MKKLFTAKSLTAIALGIAVTSLTVPTYAASCPIFPSKAKNEIAPQAPQDNQLNIPFSFGKQGQFFVIPNGQGLPVQPDQMKQDNTQPDQGMPDQMMPDQKKKDNTGQDQATENFAQEVASLVNQERAKAGLQPLQLDNSLSEVALEKAVDMEQNRYFDHVSPTLGTPSDMISKKGIQAGAVGENIAMGQRSPQEVVQQWMGSQGHRENILNPNFKKIGVGCHNNYWVQEFIG